MATTAPAPESQVELSAGEARVFNVKAGQFVDFAVVSKPLVASVYAFADGDPMEWLSVGNTRILLGRLRPRLGDRLFSNRRRALFVWVEDSSGAHDLLLPARVMSAGKSVAGPAPQLADVLRQAGADATCAPDPLNLFLDTRVDAHGRIHVLPPAINPSDHLLLRATAALRCVILIWQQDAPCARRPDARTLRFSISNRWQAR